MGVPAAGMAGRRVRVDVKKAQRPPLTPEALDKLRELLAGSDQTTVMSGVKALADSSAGNASVPLMELLAIGTRPAAAIAAIDALRKLHTSHSSGVTNSDSPENRDRHT